LGLILWLVIVKTDVFVEMTWVLLGAFFLGLTLRPAADRLQEHNIPRGVTILGIYVLFILLMILGAVLIFPLIDQDLVALQEEAPGALRYLVARLRAIPTVGRVVPRFDAIIDNMGEDGALWTSLRSVASTAAEVATDGVAVIFLGFFVASQERFATRIIHHWTRRDERERLEWLVERIEFQLSRWVSAQIVISIYYAVVSYVGLTLLGVPYAALISVVGALLEVVPYLGTLGAILAIISAVTVRPLLGLWVALYYVATMQVKANLVEPALYGRVLGLHPALVLLAMLIGVKTAGVVGLLFSVPLAFTIKDVLEAWRPDLVGDEEDEVPDNDEV
jgi:predicted PurR-regulated permease PerM